MLVRGIIQHISDVDVICRGAAWETVQRIGTLQYNDDYDVAIVTLNDGRMTFGNKWGIGNLDIDVLIDEAENIDGLPFVQLKRVVEYKLVRASRKDMQHIELPKHSKYFSLVRDLI